MIKRPTAHKPLILLDRDGTLIVERNYLTDPAQVRFLPGVMSSLKRLKRAGFPVVVVTNQSGVGRGTVTLRQLQAVNRRFLSRLQQANVALDGLYWCPHAPADRCSCRKPRLGLVKRAARDLHRSWKNSISIGDRPSDVQLGQRTGGKGILFMTGYGSQWARQPRVVKPDYRATDFERAVDWILSRKERTLS